MMDKTLRHGTSHGDAAGPATPTPRVEPDVPRERNSQWSAQFFVAGELARRGYMVSFTMGNTTPIADIVVSTPDGRCLFLVDVKGQFGKSAWLVKRKARTENLFYILAHIPPEAAPKYFILTQPDVDALLDERLRQRQERGLKADTGHSGFVWKAADRTEFRNRWDRLPK